VSQVKLAGDVGRRHDDGERLLRMVYLGSEIALLQPELIGSVFNLSGFVGLG
jgi:hypothetical protein